MTARSWQRVIRFSTTSTYGELFLVRLTANGERISSFGINGVSFLTSFEEVQSVDFVGVKDNGKFVAAGTFLENGENTKFVAQFLANGTRDNGFSDDGIVTNTVVGGATEIVGDSVVLGWKQYLHQIAVATTPRLLFQACLIMVVLTQDLVTTVLLVPSGPHTGTADRLSIDGCQNFSYNRGLGQNLLFGGYQRNVGAD